MTQAQHALTPFECTFHTRNERTIHEEPPVNNERQIARHYSNVLPREVAMGKSITPLLAATFLTAAVAALSAPAAAMEAREAMKRCDASPGCTYNVLDNGSVVIRGPKGGSVDCGLRGACVAVPIKGDKPKPGAAGNVTGVLSGSTGGASRPDTPTRKNAVSVVGGSGAAGPAGDNKVTTQQARDRQPSAGANTSDSKKH
ncbi:hypothetical protein IVB18_38790 [Bradyrhizobium sp. 186]|uniref:hypothetical protein n=1 Tax=Bradyrhizobium sp. 186 TaxID=2782654 RepID=UPI0020019019|nr:hypothetical protein [Bradyrhizobium sp. 186]UPK34057.1 hypothetical protein IVB18_38790 [Bradyrhizobium sp. 186]